MGTGGEVVKAGGGLIWVRDGESWEGTESIVQLDTKLNLLVKRNLIEQLLQLDCPVGVSVGHFLD